LCWLVWSKPTRKAWSTPWTDSASTWPSRPPKSSACSPRAHDLSLPIKLHAEQLSWQGGAALTARHGGLSADHLEYMTADDAELMAKSGTVAVLLPGAFYMLRETRLPPVAALRQPDATSRSRLTPTPEPRP
jgi:hypothetical protein